MVQTIHAICAFFISVQPVVCHMEMSWPYALRSKFNPDNSYSIIDYSNTSPLLPDGSNFPCKGYQNDRPFEVVAEFVAGSDHNITLAGSATHDGGSCQISLSYDNGATFRVIKSVINGCPLVSSYDFTVPSTAPSGNALLAWTWQNLEGNREYYMNCAQINVVAAATRRRRRSAFNTFDSLPLIWKANLEGLNDCATTEGVDVVYPSPGPSISYGNGLSDSSPPTPGTCDAASPYGETYKDLGDSTLPDSANGSMAPDPSITTASKVASLGFITIATLLPATTSFAFTAISTHVPRSLAMTQAKLAVMTTSSASTSTVTVFIDSCETTTTVTLSKPSQTPASTSHAPAPTTESIPPAAASAHPLYATGDANGPNGYLPCVPGTFLCTSRTTWLTCNYNDGTVTSSSMTWVWDTERTVAAGMECLPFLSPYSGQTSTQQSNSPAGSYRDDRYVRDRPDGDCDVDGSILCTYGGDQFDLCDQGKLNLRD